MSTKEDSQSTLVPLSSTPPQVLNRAEELQKTIHRAEDIQEGYLKLLNYLNELLQLKSQNSIEKLNQDPKAIQPNKKRVVPDTDAKVVVKNEEPDNNDNENENDDNDNENDNDNDQENENKEENNEESDNDDDDISANLRDLVKKVPRSLAKPKQPGKQVKTSKHVNLSKPVANHKKQVKQVKPKPVVASVSGSEPNKKKTV